MRAHLALSVGDAGGAKAASVAALAQAQNPNDKANALRGLAEACLALNQITEAISNAEQALQIDQKQGSSARVIADLSLLSAIYAKAGNSSQSAAYAAQSQAAARARALLTTR